MAHIAFPRRAKGRPINANRGMNRSEVAYTGELRTRQCLGEVLWWAFEPVKFRLADKTFYTPDFLVMLADGTLECHEVKGHWEDDARVKIKVVAEQFPMFRFLAARIDRRKAAAIEEIPAGRGCNGIMGEAK